jgi:hypothetical protein
MKIATHGESLAKALDAVIKLAPPTSGNVTLGGYGKKVKIQSAADTSYVVSTVPGDVFAEGETAVPLQGLKDAIKGHGDCKIAMANSALRIKADSYEANLSTVDPLPIEASTDKGDTQTCNISPDHGAWLLEAARAVNLKPTPLLNAFMPIAVVIGKAGTTVACYDNNHMAWRKTKEVTGSFEAVLPATTLIAILEVMAGLPFKMAVAANNVVITSKLHEINLSLPNVTEGMPAIAEVLEMTKSAASAKAEVIEVAQADLQAFFANARAVVARERPELQITCTGSALELVVATVTGKVQRSVPAKGPKGASFKLDAEQLQEMVSKAPTEVSLGLVKGAYVFAKLKDCATIVSLNQ